jgi:hypothetical protein
MGLAACVMAVVSGCADPHAGAQNRRKATVVEVTFEPVAPAPKRGGAAVPAKAVDVKIKPVHTPPPSGGSKPVDVKQITGDGITLPANRLHVKPPKAQSEFVFAIEGTAAEATDGDAMPAITPRREVEAEAR